jgi:hypothetical protein
MTYASRPASAPRYEVVVFVANYDCYDRITGWRGRRIAVANTKSWALALCDRQDFDHDIHAEVRDIATGKRVVPDFAPIDWSLEDQIPF